MLGAIRPPDHNAFHIVYHELGAGDCMLSAGRWAGGVFTLTIRAMAEVDADGDAFTGTYTTELAMPDGTSQGRCRA